MIFSDTQAQVRELARCFALEQLRPNSRQWEAQRSVPTSILTEMGSLGFLGMTVAESEGGAGLDCVSYALALTEIAAGDGAVSTIMSVNNAPVCAMLAASGSLEQRRLFLDPLARGRMIGAFALTEPSAGSDASQIKLRASRVVGGYRLSGIKQFITSGSTAGLIITLAVTDPAVGKNGISAFLIPSPRAGLEVTRVEMKMGQAASDTVQLTFCDVFVPDELRLGEEGAGYRMALDNLELGRIGIAAQSVGMAQAALEIALSYARERRAFGRKLTEHQAVLFRLVDMSVEIEAARQLLLSAAALRDAGVPCAREACTAKLFASEMAESVVSRAIQVLGGYGYIQDFLIEKIYRDVRVCQIYEGTSDIQRLVIGREMCLV